MKEAFAVQTIIRRPASEVWAALTNWNNAAAWMNGVESVRSDRGNVEGAQVLFTARGKERGSKIVRVEDGREVVLRSDQGGVVAEYAYRLEPIDDSTTQLSLRAQCETRGVLWTVFAPALRLAMKMTDRGQVDALKLLVERS